MKSQMKKLGFKNDANIPVYKPLPCLRMQAMAVSTFFWIAENARLLYLVKTSYLYKKTIT